MNRLNNIIYKEENNAQILSFSKNNYSFATPENTVIRNISIQFA